MGNLRDNHSELFYKINKSKKERSEMSINLINKEINKTKKTVEKKEEK